MVRRAGDLTYRLVGELQQPLVERDRLDRPDLLPLDLDALLVGEPPGCGLGVAQHPAQPRRVEVTLVEQALGGLDDRRDDARLRDDASHRADRSAPDPLRDLADL